MIVNLTPTGWRVIYHRTHALLAAQIAGQWRRSDAPERLYETIAAISHHDDLEKEKENYELTPAGAPLDFTLSSETEPEAEIEKLKAHITDARYRGRWVTYLTSKHISYLSQGKRGSCRQWDDFLDEQLRQQEEWREALGIEKDEAERAYQFMLWCDRLSLILAQQEVPEDSRSLEITSGIDNQRYDIRQLENEHLTVEPWPFEDDQFTLNIDACHLDKLKYDSQESLIQALEDAPVEIVEWTFSKAPSGVS